MMRTVLSAAVAAVMAGVLVGADLKSGPQPGEKVPGPFHPLNINGEASGKKNCLYCEAGDSPTVAIFARNANDPVLQKLVVALDEAAVKSVKPEMNVEDTLYTFVVFCSSEDKLPARLKDIAEKSKLKKLILAIDREAGPDKYNIHKDAETTVILYKDHLVAANHTYGKGQLSEKDVPVILAEAAKLLK